MATCRTCSVVGCVYTNAFKAWAWEWVWGRRAAGPKPPSLAHAFLCVFYNQAFVQGSQREVHVCRPLVFYMVSLPSPTSLLSSEKKQEKAMKECCWKGNALSLSLFGMLTELLLFCVSLGILGCFCPPSFSRESLWIAVFTWGLEKAVIGFPPCEEGCFLGQLVSCLLHKDPGAAWSDCWRKSPCP